MAINKATLARMVDNTIEYVYPKSSADLIDYDATQTVAQKIASIDTSITTMDARITNIASSTVSGDVATDATEELVDIRLGADGTTYASAGEAVRQQLTQLSNDWSNELENGLNTLNNDCTSLKNNLNLFSDKAKFFVGNFSSPGTIGHSSRNDLIHVNIKAGEKYTVIVSLDAETSNTYEIYALYADETFVKITAYYFNRETPILTAEKDIESIGIAIAIVGQPYICDVIINILDSIFNRINTIDLIEEKINGTSEIIGTFFGTFNSTGTEAHSSTSDKIPVNISEGERFNLTANINITPSNNSFMAYAYYEDGTTEAILTARFNTTYTRTAAKNIFEIGIAVNKQDSAYTCKTVINTEKSSPFIAEQIVNINKDIDTFSAMYHEEELLMPEISTYYFEVNLKAGNKYLLISGENNEGAFTVTTSNDGSTVLENFETISAAGIERRFVPTQDAKYLRLYSNTANQSCTFIDLSTVISKLDEEMTDLVSDLTYTSIQNNKYLYINNINIKAGEKFYIKAELESGASTDVIIYPNNTNNLSIRAISYGDVFEITAPIDMTRLVGYARGLSNGIISMTLTKNSWITSAENSLDDLTDKFPSVPVYIKDTVESIKDTLYNLQSSKTVTIGLLTDIHVHGDTLDDVTQNAMMTSVSAINEIDRTNSFDIVILNGDYLYNDSNTTKETSIEWYKRLAKTIACLNPPLFIGKGNHDANDMTKSLEQYLSDDDIYKVFAKLSTADYKGNYGYIEKSYGYYDISNKKVRVIVIDTVDNPFIIENEEIKYSEQHTICVSNKQLQFIAEALKFTDSGWGVVFVSHHALQNGSGINPKESTDVYIPLNHGGSQLLGIIDAYCNKTNYSNTSTTGDFIYDISVDYSDNKSNEVIAMFSGHTHRDLSDNVNGILMVSTTAASFIYDAYYADGTKINRTSQTISETSWDIITIDRAQRKLFFTRYGAGEDREFSY